MRFRVCLGLDGFSYYLTRLNNNLVKGVGGKVICAPLTFGGFSRSRLFLDRARIAGVGGYSEVKGDECTDLKEESHRRRNLVVVMVPLGLLEGDHRVGVNSEFGVICQGWRSSHDFEWVNLLVTFGARPFREGADCTAVEVPGEW